jgi:hypothetical protein
MPPTRPKVRLDGIGVDRLRGGSQLGDLSGESCVGGLAESQARIWLDALAAPLASEYVVALGTGRRDPTLDGAPALPACGVAVADFVDYVPAGVSPAVDVALNARTPSASVCLAHGVCTSWAMPPAIAVARGRFRCLCLRADRSISSGSRARGTRAATPPPGVQIGSVKPALPARRILLEGQSASSREPVQRGKREPKIGGGLAAGHPAAGRLLHL